MGGTAFYSELEAYQRVTGAEIDPWEASVLRSLYGVQIMGEAKRQKAPSGGTAKFEVTADDGAGVKGLMRGFGARKG
jgi:hypothetical protein